jgi:hypothetical protein
MECEARVYECPFTNGYLQERQNRCTWFSAAFSIMCDLEFRISAFSLFEEASVSMSMSQVVTHRSVNFDTRSTALWWFDSLASTPMCDLQSWISAFSLVEEASVSMSMSQVITKRSMEEDTRSTALIPWFAFSFMCELQLQFWMFASISFEGAII